MRRYENYRAVKRGKSKWRQEKCVVRGGKGREGETLCNGEGVRGRAGNVVQQEYKRKSWPGEV